MKELNELNFPDEVRYAKSHEWARSEGDKVKVGISDYAQDQLGDIVFVELPEVGDTIDKGEEFGTVESVKAVSELYMPVAGEVVGGEVCDECRGRRVGDANDLKVLLDFGSGDAGVGCCRQVFNIPGIDCSRECA